VWFIISAPARRGLALIPLAAVARGVAAIDAPHQMARAKHSKRVAIRTGCAAWRLRVALTGAAVWALWCAYRCSRWALARIPDFSVFACRIRLERSPGAPFTGCDEFLPRADLAPQGMAAVISGILLMSRGRIFRSWRSTAGRGESIPPSQTT